MACKALLLSTRHVTHVFLTSRPLVSNQMSRGISSLTFILKSLNSSGIFSEIKFPSKYIPYPSKEASVVTVSEDAGNVMGKHKHSGKLAQYFNSSLAASLMYMNLS